MVESGLMDTASLYQYQKLVHCVLVLVEAGTIIELVAQDSEERGLLEDAVKLYDLASKHAEVVALLNTLLAQVIALPATSRRDRIQRHAVTIAKRYKVSGVVAAR